MKTMTIRGLEPPLIDKLKENAKKQDKSLNQFVIDTLKQHNISNTYLDWY
jgi:predicted HicB family RNase H-like nuclease